jgi:hypothetical protein
MYRLFDFAATLQLIRIRRSSKIFRFDFFDKRFVAGLLEMVSPCCEGLVIAEQFSTEHFANRITQN